jgi:hypothetical protein
LLDDLDEIFTCAVMRRQFETVAGFVHEPQVGQGRLTEARRIFEDHFEDRRLVGARSTQNLQDFSRRRFTRQRVLECNIIANRWLWARNHILAPAR